MIRPSLTPWGRLLRLQVDFMTMDGTTFPRGTVVKALEPATLFVAYATGPGRTRRGMYVLFPNGHRTTLFARDLVRA
jgi:hypothetical protein